MRRIGAAPWVGLQTIWAHARAEGASRLITVGVFETIAVIGALVITLACALRLRFSYAVYMFLGSQAAWDKLRSREGNNPDRQLRSQNTS